MNFIRQCYNMTMGIVALAESSIEIVPLNAEMISEKIGGAAVNRELLETYGEAGSIVFGVGPLTGSYAPASCLLVATFRSPMTGTISHVPFMHRSGPEMKFAGYDFLVIKQAATRPIVLSVSDGNVTFLPADHMVKSAVPEIVRSLKHGVHQAQAPIITGPAADHGVPQASAVTGLWGSLDKTGLAGVMASQNLKGLIFNGIDGLPFTPDGLARSEAMIKSLGLFGPSKGNGFISVLEKLGADDDVKTMVRKSKAKHIACYRCPFPCMNHIEFPVINSHNNGGDQSVKGLNILDHMGFMTLARKYKAEAFELMSSCLRFGVDPVAVSAVLPVDGVMSDRLDAIAAISVGTDGGALKEEKLADHPVSDAIPSEKHRRFGGGLPPILSQDIADSGDAWEKRVALSLVLGICPLFLSLFPEITDEDLISFFEPEKGGARLFQGRIDSSIHLLCER